MDTLVQKRLIVSVKLPAMLPLYWTICSDWLIVLPWRPIPPMYT